MPIEKVIVNASPIIVLYKSHLESILPLLFKEILIPTTVYDEITSYSPNDKLPLNYLMQIGTIRLKLSMMKRLQLGIWEKVKAAF